VRNKFLTIATIAVIGMTTASCQLLIDNRKTGKTSVVVVPTDEWDTLRGQQMRPDIARDIAKEMAISIADELRSNQSAIAATTPVVDTPAEDIVLPVKHSAPTLIILKNEAYRLNTNILVPLSMNQTDADPIASPNIQIEARMMKCPLKLARGN